MVLLVLLVLPLASPGPIRGRFLPNLFFYPVNRANTGSPNIVSPNTVSPNTVSPNPVPSWGELTTISSDHG